MTVTISGAIQYTDIFGGPSKKRIKHFSRICIIRCPMGKSENFSAAFHTPPGLGFAGDNHEEVVDEPGEDDQDQSEDES